MMDLQDIHCIFYDFDGVMTDNRVLIGDDGHEFAFANRSDGLAVQMIKEQLGIPQVIEVFHGMSEKSATLKVYCKSHDYDLAKCVFIGNDINDVSAMKLVGLAGAPRDAWPEALKVAGWTSRKGGGQGVIAEFYREILAVRGLA